MEGFLHAVSSVTIILLLTATGYFCAARGWMGPQAKAFIGKFTLSVAIPCMSVYGLTNNLTRDLLVQSGSFLLVPLLGTVVITILSLLVGRLLKLLGVERHLRRPCDVHRALWRHLHALRHALLPRQHQLCPAAVSLACALVGREPRL